MLVVKYVRKFWTEEQIKQCIEVNDKALYGALLNLYECQTDEEKSTGVTREDNGVGFNAFDAPFLSAMVVSYKQYGHLTSGQKEKTRKLIKKYTGQLTTLANSKKYNKPVFVEEEVNEQAVS